MYLGHLVNTAMQVRIGSRMKWALLVISVAAMVITAALLMASAPGAEDDNSSISIAGLVDSPITIDLAELRSRQSVTMTAELICVSGISSGTHDWTGVRLKDLLSEAGAQADVIKVTFTSSDYYMTDLTLQDAMRDDVIIAYLEDGSPIKEKTRLVVPGKWGYKWITDIMTIELVDYDFMGKWESRGYSDDATIPT